MVENYEKKVGHFWEAHLLKIYYGNIVTPAIATKDADRVGNQTKEIKTKDRKQLFVFSVFHQFKKQAQILDGSAKGD